MKWKDTYNDKKINHIEAIKKIQNNSKIFIGHVASEPQKMVEEIVRNKELFKGIEIYHMFTLGNADYCSSNMSEHFTHKSFFLGTSTKSAVQENRADFIPVFFHKIPELLRSEIKLDTTIVQLSSPNDSGYLSLGVNCDCTKAAVESAKFVIGEVNDQVPFTYGDNLIHISDIDYIVEASYPIHEVHAAEIGETERTIGENCARLIDDGSTLQLGIGSIPDAVLASLKDKKDLGIHSEMISDGIIDLVDSGVITGEMKSINKGKIVVSFIMGSKKLYDYVNQNDKITFFPVDYVNNPFIIMQNHKMVSINSCIEIDFSGQVASESIGMNQISGVGGQVDFVRGATMAPNGKSIIAMPSTAKNKSVSRIVPFLTDNSFVTTSRNDIDYVVTEYGTVKLSGRSIKERAKSLISIAHPKFRDELMEEFDNRFI